jgi:hypothetical protein
MHKYLQQIGSILTVLLLAACAQIVAPTGGDKDFVPPKVTETNPPNKTINFNKKKITVEFNEYIQLNKPEDLIIISPPTETRPTFTNKGKSLEIKFNGDLLPNTTYTINFSTAVGDNKENNLLQDYNYVFSTGNNLDSGYIHGNVVNAIDNKPLADITVALYYTDSFNDSTIIKQKPVYVSKTNETGHFKISNLPSSLFKIVAFKDESKNLKVEATEEIAFINDAVQLSDTNSKPHQLYVFKPDLYEPGRIIDTFNKEPQKLVLLIYKPQHIDIKSTNNNPVYVNKINTPSGIDSFLVYIPVNPIDSMVTLLVNNQPINIKYKPIFKTPKLTYTYNKQPGLKDTLVFNFNHPITQIDTSRIKLFIDSTQQTIIGELVNPFEYRVSHDWKEKTNYKLEIADSAFVDFFNQFSTNDKAAFTSKTVKDYATLILHVQLGESVNTPVILQILNDAETSIYKEFIITKNTDIELDYVIPGNYKLKYIFDENGNGKWDNGNFKTKKQPEKVSYFKENINIKAYWDLEQSVLIE